MKITFVLLLSFYCVNISLAESKLNFTISFPKSMDPNKAMVMLDNCKTEKFIELKYLNNKTIVTDSIFGNFATLTIVYPNQDGVFKGVRLLVNARKVAYIYFRESKDSEEDRLSYFVLKNAIDVKKTKEYLLVKKFCQNEHITYDYYSKNYRTTHTDSVLKLFNEASVQLANKQLEFVKRNGNKYYYFWLFRKDIVPTLLKSKKQELYEVFQTSFSKLFQNSTEGITLRQGIEGNLFIKKGFKILDFITKDYEGKIISTSSFSEKYVLVNFWATWCLPCIAKMPLLQDIRKKYTENSLEIISISYDTDLSAFKDGVKTHKMNWINIFKDDNVINQFGNTAIPALYLIGPGGVILFSSWEDNIDSLLTILEKNLFATQ